MDGERVEARAPTSATPSTRPRPGLTLVLGGRRSGKSAWAEALAAAAGACVAYIATGRVGDAEMRSRIELHRARRPPDWITLEEPADLAGAVRRALAGVTEPARGASRSTPERSPDAVLIDSVGMAALHWLWPDGEVGDASRRAGATDAAGAPPWRKPLEALIAAAAAAPVPVIAVSDEVGTGVVPVDAGTRAYVDALGSIHQALAAAARDVYLIVAGLPLRVKGEVKADG